MQLVKVTGLKKMAKMEDGLMAPQIQVKPQVSSFLLPAFATAMAMPTIVVPPAAIGRVHRLVTMHTTWAFTMGMLSWATTIAPTGSLSAVLRTDQSSSGPKFKRQAVRRAMIFTVFSGGILSHLEKTVEFFRLCKVGNRSPFFAVASIYFGIIVSEQ